MQFFKKGMFCFFFKLLEFFLCLFVKFFQEKGVVMLFLGMEGVFLKLFKKTSFCF